MNISAETISILTFLIPGFLSSLILNELIIRRQAGNFIKLAEALIFSFFIYAIGSIWNQQVPVLLESKTSGDITSISINFEPRLLWPIALISIMLPLAIGWIITHDLHMRLLRKIRVTNLSSRSNIWLDVFSDQVKTVVVNLNDGRRVIGWPRYYSDSPEEGLLYLQNPKWITDAGYVDMDAIGLFIVQRDYIETIEFLNLPTSINQRRKGKNGRRKQRAEALQDHQA